MKIATFNVNGVNGRLFVLLQWLAKAEADVVCLQELKASQDEFLEVAIRGEHSQLLLQGWRVRAKVVPSP